MSVAFVSHIPPCICVLWFTVFQLGPEEENKSVSSFNGKGRRQSFIKPPMEISFSFARSPKASSPTASDGKATPLKSQRDVPPPASPISQVVLDTPILEATASDEKESSNGSKDGSNTDSTEDATLNSDSLCPVLQVPGGFEARLAVDTGVDWVCSVVDGSCNRRRALPLSTTVAAVAAAGGDAAVPDILTQQDSRESMPALYVDSSISGDTGDVPGRRITRRKGTTSAAGPDVADKSPAVDGTERTAKVAVSSPTPAVHAGPDKQERQHHVQPHHQPQALPQPQPQPQPQHGKRQQQDDNHNGSMKDDAQQLLAAELGGKDDMLATTDSQESDLISDRGSQPTAAIKADAQQLLAAELGGQDDLLVADSQESDLISDRGSKPSAGIKVNDSVSKRPSFQDDVSHLGASGADSSGRRERHHDHRSHASADRIQQKEEQHPDPMDNQEDDAALLSELSDDSHSRGRAYSRPLERRSIGSNPEKTRSAPIPNAEESGRSSLAETTNGKATPIPTTDPMKPEEEQPKDSFQLGVLCGDLLQSTIDMCGKDGANDIIAKMRDNACAAQARSVGQAADTESQNDVARAETQESKPLTVDGIQATISDAMAGATETCGNINDNVRNHQQAPGQ